MGGHLEAEGTSPVLFEVEGGVLKVKGTFPALSQSVNQKVSQSVSFMSILCEKPSYAPPRPPIFCNFWICSLRLAHCQRMIDGLLQGWSVLVSPLTDIGLIYQRP